MVCVLVVTAIVGHVIVSISLTTLFNRPVAPVISPACSGHVSNEVAWAKLVTWAEEIGRSTTMTQLGRGDLSGSKSWSEQELQRKCCVLWYMG